MKGLKAKGCVVLSEGQRLILMDRELACRDPTFCAEIQRDDWGVTYGTPDELLNSGGRGQAGEFQRSHFRHWPVARLRIGKRLQHRVQEGHWLFATAI
jgi:hypothetical protein